MTVLGGGREQNTIPKGYIMTLRHDMISDTLKLGGDVRIEKIRKITTATIVTILSSYFVARIVLGAFPRFSHWLLTPL